MVCGVVAAVFLSAPVALGDNPPGPQQAADQFAKTTCASLQQSLGAKFSTIFSSLDDCQSKLSGAFLGCAANAKPGSDAFAQCMQAVLPKPTGGGGGGGGGAPDPLQMASQIAKSLCNSLQKNLGDAFTAKYGSLDACVAKFTDDAAKLVTSCLAAGKVGSDAFNKCLADGTKALLPPPPQQPPPSSGQQAAGIAKSICTSIQKQLGDSFASKYGSLDACVAKFTSVAAGILDNCKSAGVPTSDAFKQCLGNALKDAIPPPPLDSSKIADGFATGVCKALGGDLDACKAKLATAASNAVAACLAAGNPPSDAFKKCMGDAAKDLVQANGGPAAASPAKLADSIATGACAGFQKANPTAFAAQFASLDACVAAITPVAANAVATCSGKVGSDTWSSCVKAAISAAFSKK